MTQVPFDPTPPSIREPMNHTPFDYGEYFTRLGEPYVMRSLMHESFDPRTAAAARVWLEYRARLKTEKDRVRTVLFAILGAAIAISGVVATAIFH